MTALVREQADLTRPDTVRAALAACRPDVVINCAAYNFVDRAEEEPEAAFAVNAAGPRHLALACAEVGATLPLLAPPQGKPYGYLDPAAWRTYARWMADHGLISSPPPPSRVLTNDLLP